MKDPEATGTRNDLRSGAGTGNLLGFNDIYRLFAIVIAAMIPSLPDSARPNRRPENGAVAIMLVNLGKSTASGGSG